MFTAILLSVVAAAPVPVPKAGPPEPAWMAAYRKAYELKPEQVVKRVAPPYIPERIDFELNHFWPGGKGLTPEREKANREDFAKNAKWMTHFVEQDGTALKMRSVISSMGLAGMPEKHRGDNLFEVSDAVAQISGLGDPEFIVDPKHTGDKLFAEGNLTVHGDFVTRRYAEPEKLAVQLQKILVEECKIPVTLRVEYPEQDVYVVAGTFKLQPPEWRLNDTKKRLQTLVDVYATFDGLNGQYDHFDSESQRQYKGRAKSSQYGGEPVDFVRFIGARVKTRMVWDKSLPREPHFSWCDHKVKDPTPADEADDRDPEKVLRNVAAQTGLTFTKAKRKVPVLVLAPAK